MITKVTQDNSDLYRSLFEKASAKLELTDSITSLDEYFACVKDLAAIDKVFTVLPLDEPTLDIDADTRTINIPKEFKNNGISVKGDQIAEILYFTIDRYFDSTDLYDDSVNIIIQWETAPKNGTADQGISKAVFKDVSILKEQGKMLFGWAINSNITEASGTIKFSVRFYSTKLDSNNTPQIIFSLSTLTANAIINPGLDYQFTNGVPSQTVYDDSELINNRLRNSIYDGGDDVAALPTFSENIGSGSVDLSDGSYTFKALATSSDGGSITYSWHRSPVSGTGGDSEFATGDGFRKTADTTWQADKSYFKIVTTNNISRYTLIESTTYTVGNAIPSGASDPVIYERGATTTVSQTGNYYVIASNRHGLATKTANSNTVTIPGPATLEAHVVDLTADTEGKYHDFIDDTTRDGIIAVSGSTLQSGDTIQYQWSKKVGDEYVDIEDADDAEYAIAAIAEDDAHLYDQWFKAVVKASRNGDTTDPKAFEFRVTHSAEAPTITTSTSPINVGASSPVTISVTADTTGILSDSLSYQWCKYSEDTSDDETVEGATSASLEVSKANAGTYYCKVTNVVNGQSKVVDSSQIVVSGI